MLIVENFHSIQMDSEYKFQQQSRNKQMLTTLDLTCFDKNNINYFGREIMHLIGPI